MHRILSRITVALATLAGLTALHGAASGQTYSVWDFGKRIQADVQLGGLLESEPNLPDWKGVDLASTVTYSLHPRLSLYGLYQHGFPLEDSPGHRNILTAAANLKIYPGPLEPGSGTSVWIGAGGLWLGESSVKDWSGLTGQVVIARRFAPGWALYGKYAHGFSLDPLTPDLDLGRVGVKRKLWP